MDTPAGDMMLAELRGLLGEAITAALAVADAPTAWDTPWADSPAGAELDAEEARRPEPLAGSWPWLAAPMFARWALQVAASAATGFCAVLGHDATSYAADAVPGNSGELVAGVVAVQPVDQRSGQPLLGPDVRIKSSWRASLAMLTNTAELTVRIEPPGSSAAHPSRPSAVPLSIRSGHWRPRRAARSHGRTADKRSVSVAAVLLGGVLPGSASATRCDSQTIKKPGRRLWLPGLSPALTW